MYILYQLKCLFQSIYQQYRRLNYRIKNRYFPSALKDKMGLPPAIPEWALSEMKELGQAIDPAIYPTEQFLASCAYYAFPLQSQPGVIYGELLKQCRHQKYTHCFAIPWLKRGGADLVSLMYIELVAKLQNTQVLVMLTEPGDSPWLNRIPKHVDVLDVSKYVYQASHAELLSIMVRLMMQLHVAVLHVINSRHAWEMISKYGLALKQSTRIFASVFCDDYDEFNQPVGFARQYLPSCYQYIQTIFSDNQEFPSKLQQIYGYPLSMFKVLNTPFNMHSYSAPSPQKGLARVLWAGRLDWQKRPDILMKIAQAMPDVEFHVYGEEVLGEKNGFQSKLKKIKNIILYGHFEGAQKIPFNDFPVFLYTSQWDGMPTIVLAAASSGIPIVASVVGGLQSLMTEDRGVPIFQIENVDDYVQAIRAVLQEPKEAYRRAKNLQNYIEHQHSYANFESSMRTVSGYMQRDVEKYDESRVYA